MAKEMGFLNLRFLNGKKNLKGVFTEIEGVVTN